MIYFRKYYLYLFILFLIFIGFSCDEAIELPSPDGTPPVASFIHPLDGDIVEGDYTIQVRAVDNEGMYKVDFYLNQIKVGTDSFPNGDIFEYEWNTFQTDTLTNKYIYDEDSYHYLYFVASDINDNDYASYAIRAFINNFDNESPNAIIISPYNNQIITEPFDIEILATDNDSIQFVSFYADNILIGNQTIPTCTDEISPVTGDTVQNCYYIWSNVTPALLGGNGLHSIHAIVRDMNNNPSTISPITIIVNEQYDLIPPSGTIISPASGLEVSDIVDITVQATDNDTIHSVIFYVNGEPAELITHNPFDPDNSQGNYIFSWNSANGIEDAENIISVTLRDQSLNETPIAPITLIVNNNLSMDTEAPFVLITSPAAGQTISNETEIIVYATDNDEVSSVVFFINEEPEHIDSTGLDNYFTYLWNTNSLEDDIDYYLTAVAIDPTGNNTIASSITVHIDNNDNIYPTGFIQNPAAGQIVSEIVTIAIIADDNVNVDIVNLFIDGNLRAELSESPYNFEWDTTIEDEDEEHTLAISITDLYGNTTSNPPISVFVDNIINEDTIYPTGAITNPISGETVTDTVLFSVSAQDNISISEVQFLINDEIINSTNNEPYEYPWDTSPFSGTDCTLSAIIIDNSNNTTYLQPIMVSVE